MQSTVDDAQSVKTEGDAATIRATSTQFSDHEDDEEDDHPGDYSARMEELLDDDDESTDARGLQNDSDEEDGFEYTGVDAGDTSASTGYRERLRDVLGETDSEDEKLEVEQSLVIEEVDSTVDATDDGAVRSQRETLLSVLIFPRTRTQCR